jgi:hypothetical protein
MPLQNRVTPYGEVVFSQARGTLMGNRGCLHDDNRTLGTRRWTTQTWVTCLLSFGGRRRELMRPGFYTELFFLDEATALAAGHRPCGECRREAHRRFVTSWAHGAGRSPETVRARDLDRSLHVARVDRRRNKITFQASFGDLPDGAMFAANGAAFLKRREFARPWAPEGYGRETFVPRESGVTVLTPRPIVEALRAGYVPAMHASVEQG